MRPSCSASMAASSACTISSSAAISRRPVGSQAFLSSARYPDSQMENASRLWDAVVLRFAESFRALNKALIAPEYSAPREKRMKNLFVVTHAQSLHHIEKKVGGWYDTGLTQQG